MVVTFIQRWYLCISNGHFNFYTRFNTDGSNLLHNLRGTVQINQALVDPHLESIPCLGTLTTRGFSCSNAQSLKDKNLDLKKYQDYPL